MLELGNKDKILLLMRVIYNAIKKEYMARGISPDELKWEENLAQQFFNVVKRIPAKSNKESLYMAVLGVVLGIVSRIQFSRPTAWVCNVTSKSHQRFIRKCLGDYQVRFLPVSKRIYSIKTLIEWSNKPFFVVWGINQPDDLEEFSAEFGIPIHRMGDGFINAIDFDSGEIMRCSAFIDKQGIYFDYSRPSDLESLIQNYDFDGDPKLMTTAAACLAKFRNGGLSKHNRVRTDLARHLYGPKTRARILVLGQVEDAQSLICGCARVLSNAELIQLAADENPDAQIIYKPHPDVMSGKRKELSRPSAMARLAEILPFALSLKDALYEVDRVYTQTSLAGFEALIHGVSVTTVGAPFYSGWGLTDDRQSVPRRKRQASLEQVFAASYLLYSRYHDPKSHAKTTLAELIDSILRRLDNIKVITPTVSVERLKLVNLATQNRVSPRLVCNSSAESIAIVVDSPKGLLIARGMVGCGKKIVVMTTRDALANDNAMLLSAEERETIQVVSIHKCYNVPFSEIERQSVALTKMFSSRFKTVLRDVTGDHLDESTLSALAFGLEDFIYYEALRFYGAKACLEEFGSVLLLLDDLQSNRDVVKAFMFHGKADDSEGRLFAYPWIIDELRKLFGVSSPVFSGILNSVGEKNKFSSFWWDIQDQKYNDYNWIGDFVAVCGNISNENYAYSPASLKLLEVVDGKDMLNTLYFPSGLLNAEGQDAVRTIILENNLSKRVSVYNGFLGRYKLKYSPQVLDNVNQVCDHLYKIFMGNARTSLPENFVDIFAPRLEKYFKGLSVQFIFIAEVGKILEKSKLFATAMDRTHVSRLIAAIAKKQGVPSIGIQPQIISTSPRYLAPAVDRMGVIDTSQVEVFCQLGAMSETLHPVGAVNILSRLIRIDECRAQPVSSDISRTLFFAMQHSNPKEMISTALSLRTICERHGFRLIVKPHPHQELPIQHEIRNIFAHSDFVKIAPKDGDTYEYLASCSVVIGLFSSVLLEAALSGMDVIVAGFARELDPSIDFSRLGLALKATDHDSFEAFVIDVMSQGPLSLQLRDSRQAYLRENPQFQRPYSYRVLEQFIESSIPS